MIPRLQIVKSFIDTHPLGFIATVSSAQVPELGVVYVHANESLHCFCVTKSSTRKYQNIKRLSPVTFGFVDEKEMIFVEVSGTATFIEDAEHIASLLSIMEETIFARDLSYWVPPVNQIEGDQFAFFEVTPRHVAYRNYANLADGLDAKPSIFTIDL